MDLHGEDVRQRRVGPAAVAEAGVAAEHHQARPLPHGLGQQPLLRRRSGSRRGGRSRMKTLYRPGANSASSTAPWSPCAGALITSASTWMSCEVAIEQHHELVVPGQVRPLEEQDVEPAAEDRDERADLVVGLDQLAVLGGDLERDHASRRASAGCIQAGDRDDVGRRRGPSPGSWPRGSASSSTKSSTSSVWLANPRASERALDLQVDSSRRPSGRRRCRAA